MAIKKYTDESQGLFGTRKRVRATGGADIKAALRRLSESWQPEAVFDRVERAARAVLADYGYKEHHVPDGADPIAKDADSVLVWLCEIRAQVAKCRDSDSAALIARNALTCGAIVQRMGLRVFEVFAARGVKKTADGRRGQCRAYGTHKQKAARRRQYIELWGKLRDRFPKYSKSEIDGKVAKKFKVSAKTIQRARRIEQSKKK